MSKYYTNSLLLLITLALLSCEEVNFKQAQPSGVNSLDKFPESLQGQYVSRDHDTLYVNEYSLSLFNRSNPCDKLSEHDTLSDMINLKQWNGYYFLNINEYGLWSVLLIDIHHQDSVIVSMISSEDETTLAAIGLITPIEKQYDENGDILRYTIDPTPQQLSLIVEKDLFSTISIFQNIKSH